MWILADDNTVIINPFNIESFELNNTSIYINTCSGKTHLFGRFESVTEAIEAMNALRRDMAYVLKR